ncbi:MAG TPA: phenylalanine--tRNA ligase subunit alpha [Saprospiraceae bacterium]|nr:phenylalanine--tRNA ligase subunit alpha [Saprospiraceae bacterium]
MNFSFENLEEIYRQINAYEIKSSDDLEQFRIKFLGTKNVIKPLFGAIKDIPNDQKKNYGQEVNSLKSAAEIKYEEVKTHLDADQKSKAIADLDLTLPGEPLNMGSQHPVSIMMNKIIDIFEKIGFAVAEEREIEDDWHNFSAMNTPEDHPARDMQDTFYLMDSTKYLLRTHTSSVQARVMTTQKPPIRIIAPGRVYRNETISARSHCQFHQVEGLYIDEKVSFADLKQTLLYFAKEMYGENAKIRLRPSYFPFTEPSAEMDVWLGTETEKTYRLTKGTGWLEIMGCGMVDPQVLVNCGIDPEKYSGYAFGMGVERQALTKFDIGDIRLLFENDVRFLKQFSTVI